MTGDADAFVRPFMVTGGRTRSAGAELRVEALVVAAPDASAASLRFERAAAVRLCVTPTSVAELGARLGLPLGVARVLVGDLVAEGHVRVHQASELSIELLERIRDRVRAL
ncbi:DUF742 domain-containing protein [Lentzea cavernae]|uniref:DUF742 domain-containing protein n=1 Tax=Lentzea cavernae TaxID=2020703 RepID=A0ABQ3MPH9_9PSEU|nr:DUF742 domain-containing protein [Lentzea cavernae]GHH56411.1 hypothetical protein GCM10017774_74420 [Lentzea cavernae]